MKENDFDRYSIVPMLRRLRRRWLIASGGGKMNGCVETYQCRVLLLKKNNGGGMEELYFFMPWFSFSAFKTFSSYLHKQAVFSD